MNGRPQHWRLITAAAAALVLLSVCPVIAEPPSTFATEILLGDALPAAPVAPAIAGLGPRGNDYPTSRATVFLGGRMQLDAVDYISTEVIRDRIPGFSPLQPGVSFRRLRLDASGSLHSNIDYMLQIDFANGIRPGDVATSVAVPTDAWITFRNLPVLGNVRLGNQKPFYSFEHLTSSRYLNFLERSLGFDAFVENFNNGFSPGISAFDTYLDQRGTWGVGFFNNVRSVFGYNVGRGEYDANARITFLPIDDDDGRKLLHVGVGTSIRDPDNGLFRARARLDARNSPSALSTLVADTSLVPASGQKLLIPELAAVCGPFSMQSEYYACWVSGVRAPVNGGFVPLGTVFLSSWYVEGHVFLTGEHRAYNRNGGVFAAVKPLRPVEWTRSGFTGCGAWQLTARYSYLDLNDRQLQGGRVNDLTLGVNWFLNEYLKFQGNFFLADRQGTPDGGNGTIYGFATRMALDF